jgi:hypothetical protein
MLNTKKFLYILPDTAYVAELLPGKKPHTFSIHAFRQVNGSFIDENEFIAENVEKLIKKIDADEYHLVLPDFLFTNTMVDVNETSEAEVKKYLKEKLLPELGLAKDTHEIDTFILTQHQGKTKVQLSALEKSLLTPIRKAAAEQKINISHISPLSWTIKSVISLEPSLSTVQIGGMLYLAQHYIGVDQAVSFKIEETENIVETVKTLKGAEPNIQTMYLLTNALVENDLKEKLSGTLPIQQLSNYADDQEGIPSFIKNIIEAAAKTLDINDYPVPKFNIGKFDPTAEEVKKEEKTEEEPDTVTQSPEESTETKTETKEEEMTTDLPTPTLPTPATSAVEPEITAMETAVESTTVSATKPLSLDDEILPLPTTQDTGVIASMPDTSVSPIEPISPPEQENKVESPVITSPVIEPITPPSVEPVITPSVTAPLSAPAPAQPILVQPLTQAPPIMPQNTPFTSNMPVSTGPTTSILPPAGPTRPVIKNKSDASALIRMTLITLGALIVTVVVGVGVGFLALSLSEKKNAGLNHNPVVESTTTPTPTIAPSPTPSPSPLVAIDKSKLKILVVNATTTSGKASKFKKLLTDTGYTTVDTGNAKGEYKENEGTLILMKEKDQNLIDTMQKDSGTTLTYKDGVATEDAKAAYDVVIVLAE